MAIQPPAPPQNTYDGAEASADAQKAALTKLLAEQGALGAQTIQNRSQDAAAIAAAAQAQFGNGTGVPYQTFSRDTEQAATNQAQHLARIQAANQAYQDQAKAAIPLQRADIDAMYNAQRMEYEERQREREAEEARRAQAAADQRRAAAASAKQFQSVYDKMRESTDAENRIRKEEAAKIPNTQRPLSLQRELGVQQNKFNWEDATAMVGVDPRTARTLRTNPNTKAYERMVADLIAEATQADQSWDAVVAAARGAAGDPAFLAEYGVAHSAGAMGDAWNSIIQPLLIMQSGQWGVLPQEWVQGYRKAARKQGTAAGK